MQKRLFIIIIIFSIIFLKIGKVTAQDVHFSQFYANPVYLNPAFAGANVCPRIVTNFRDQWPSISGTFVSYSASWDQHFDKLAGGVGVLLLGDRAGQGTISTYAASLIYSYKLKVNRKFNMRFALQATYQQKH